MLGLPSTTEVGRRFPKEAFYRNLKMSPAVKESFVRDIEAITVANSVKATTANIADGARVHEILVMRIDLKGDIVPEGAIEAINGANAGKKIFVCVDDGKGCLVVKMSKLIIGPWRPLNELRLEISSESLDVLWDTLASQIVYDDTGGGGLSVEERFAKDQKVKAMKDEIAKLEARCRKEKQFNKKNELFAKVNRLKAELADFEKGM